MEKLVKRFQSKLKDEKGQNLVEFALILIVLLLIVYGITEFGYAWYRVDVLKNAANTAARTYAVTGDEDMARFKAYTAAGTTDIDVDVDVVPGADSVTVTVSEDFKTVVPGILPMLSNITKLRRDATYRLE